MADSEPGAGGTAALDGAGVVGMTELDCIEGAAGAAGGMTELDVADGAEVTGSLPEVEGAAGAGGITELEGGGGAGGITG